MSAPGLGPDCYAQHLAEVNQTNTVVATQDIRNDKGLLLVPSGTRMRPEVAEKILRHKLTAPLEAQVSLSRSLHAQQLQEALGELLQKHPDLMAMHQAQGGDAVVQGFCHQYSSFPLLEQKLTVLSMQLPRHFEAALFCAWLGLLIARERQLDGEQQRAIFLAALAQDTGLLHIDPALHQLPQLNPEQQRVLQAHPIVGKLFVEAVPRMPKAVSLAVMEHHERSDGSGFPQGLVAAKLSTEGQVLSVANAVWETRFGLLAAEGRGLGDYVPIALLKTAGAFKPWYQALVSMIRQAGLSATRRIDDVVMNDFMAALQHNQQQIGDAFKQALRIIKCLPKLTATPSTRNLQAMAERLWFAVSSSGLLNDGLKRWIQHVREQRLSIAYSEMEEVGLLQRDVQRQLAKFQQSVARFIDEAVKQPAAQALSEDLRWELEDAGQQLWLSAGEGGLMPSPGANVTTVTPATTAAVAGMV